MNPTPSPDRLIPYAKDHDRLQLALLYIEAECNRYKETGAELEALRVDKEIIQRSLERLSKLRESKIKQYINEHHPAKYIDSTGRAVVTDFDSQPTQGKEGTKEWHDQEMERVFSMERSEMRTLTAVLQKIKVIEEGQRRLSERTAQKKEILKLIEQLHATAFDGGTPEFPHEDQLETLVEVAEIALKGEQTILDKLHQEDGLVWLEQIAGSAQNALDEISSLMHEMYRKLNRERPISAGIFLLKEFWKLKIFDRCKIAAQLCQAWKEGIDNHFSEHPGTILSPRAQEKIPQVDPKELMEVFSQAASMNSSVQQADDRSVALLDNARQARGEIRATNSAVELMKGRAEKSVTKAKTMLDLRRRQLAAARSQILDHVVDPEKCPLEQRAERLPDYPEQILVHDLPASHPSVSRLLAESETYSVDAYVNDIVNSRLNRARRTTHPPVLLSTRYQPPVYDELEDPELLRRHYQRDVPLIEGATPVYTEEPDYGGMVQTDASELSPVVRGELNELASKAREQLGLKSKAQQNQFDEMVRTLMSILEGSGIPLIIPGPGVRF